MLIWTLDLVHAADVLGGAMWVFLGLSLIVNAIILL